VTIGDLSRLVVRARVPERYYAEFNARAPDGRRSAVSVRVSQEGAGEHAARISSVAPFVSAENKTFEVSCDLGGDTTALRPGMSVVALFTMERREGLWSLPHAALLGGNTLWYVETAPDGTEVARSMEVEPGFSTDERFAIPAAEAGKAFIVEGHHFLREGSRVRVAGEARTP
jgi:multidrug efflux pump subunit AcrA (membrane-fusion protein)